MVECDLAKVEVAGSNPVSRSNIDFALEPPLRGGALRPSLAAAGAPLPAIDSIISC